MAISSVLLTFNFRKWLLHLLPMMSLDMWTEEGVGLWEDLLHSASSNMCGLNQCGDILLFPQVFLSVPGLPLLEKDESYSCFFQDTHSPASVTESGVTCHSPDTSRVPVVPPGQGEHVLTPQLTVYCNWNKADGACVLICCSDLFNSGIGGFGCIM